MASSSSQRSQSRRLIEYAGSHGPYLWSGTDIENALLWFTESEDGGLSNTTTPRSILPEAVEDGGYDFLRLLLQSRGIWNPRPPKRKRTSKNDKSTLSTETNKRKGKKKRVDNNCNREEGSRRSHTNRELSSPLQSVLLGYYQLNKKIVTPTDSSLGDDVINNGKVEDDNDASASLDASAKLYNDLTTIISSRRHTNEIYQAALRTTIAANTDNATAPSTIVSSSQQQELILEPSRSRQNNKFNMATKIDQYMVHPTACARRVYAASLYDRLIHLSSTKEGVAMDTTVVQPFLQKLLGLSMADDAGKVKEVILLLVLEPLRRRQTRQMQSTKKRAEKTPPQNHDHDELLPPQLSQQDQHWRLEHSMELFPLLTSQPASSSKTKNDNKSDEIDSKCDESSCPLTALLVKSILHMNNLDTWWSQPSPLLCAVSQYYFPIACKYLHYWVDRAIDTHERLYHDREDTFEDVFQHALERMQQFHQTSHRLRSLLSHVIHSKEEQMMLSSRDLTDEDEEERDSLFCRSLALRAIKRALEE